MWWHSRAGVGECSGVGECDGVGECGGVMVWGCDGASGVLCKGTPLIRLTPNNAVSSSKLLMI